MGLPYPSMDFVPFDVLTAEELDHMVANDAALAAGTGFDFSTAGVLVTDASGDVTSNAPASASVTTTQTTTSTSYTDLATAGPSITVTIGDNGSVLIGFETVAYINAADFITVSFAASGANTIAAGTAPYEVRFKAANTANDGRLAGTWLITGLTAGSTTFTMKYKVASGTGTFSNRHLYAIPM